MVEDFAVVNGEIHANGELYEIPSIRILDLRLFCQDELHSLASFCTTSPNEHVDNGFQYVVDKLMFNRSSGSHRQTYDKEYTECTPKRRRKECQDVPSHPGLDLGDILGLSSKISHRDLILRLCKQFHIHDQMDKSPQKSSHSPSPKTSMVEMKSKRRKEVCITNTSKKSNKKRSREDSLSRNSKRVKLLHNLSNKDEWHNGSSIFPKKENKSKIRGVENEEITAFMSLENKSSSSIKKTEATQDTPPKPIKSPAVAITQAAKNVLRHIHNSPEVGNLTVHSDSKSSQTLNEVSSDTFFKSTAAAMLQNNGIITKSRFLCATCGKTFANNYNLKRHGRTVDHLLQIGVLQNQSNKHNGHNLRHQQATRGKSGLFKCQECYRTFKKKKQYNQHLKSHMRPQKRNITFIRKQGLSCPTKGDENVNSLKSEVIKSDPKLNGRAISFEIIADTAHGNVVPSSDNKSIVYLMSRTNNQSSNNHICLENITFDINELSALGFQRLLSTRSGSFLTGFPAKLLFQKNLDLSLPGRC